MPQTFLETCQNTLFVACFDVDDAIWSKPCLGDRWREQVGPRQAPERFAFRTRRDACHKQGGGGTVDRAIAAAGDLMQCPKCKAAAWQAGVDLPQPEREDRAEYSSLTFNALDVGAQSTDSRRA